MKDLQNQLALSKLREAETHSSIKQLEKRVVEMDRCWQVGGWIGYKRGEKFGCNWGVKDGCIEGKGEEGLGV